METTLTRAARIYREADRIAKREGHKAALSYVLAKLREANDSDLELALMDLCLHSLIMESRDSSEL